MMDPHKNAPWNDPQAHEYLVAAIKLSLKRFYELCVNVQQLMGGADSENFLKMYSEFRHGLSEKETAV